MLVLTLPAAVLAADPLPEVRAAEIAAARDPRLVFVCAGRGTDSHSRCREALRGPLRGRLRLLGERVDIPRVMAGIDILVSSSNTEGCPNAVGEGMACGLPVIGTDIGDTRDVIGDTGRIVPCGDAARLAAEVELVSAIGHARRREVGDAARERIRTAYSIESVASRYGRLDHEIVSERRGSGERLGSERLLPARAAEPAV
jgi:glycosyltransferase involved in cell wall biosynthesis